MPGELQFAHQCLCQGVRCHQCVPETAGVTRDGSEIRSLNHGLPRKDTFPHDGSIVRGAPGDERQEMLQSDLQPSAISFNSAPWTHSSALVVVGILMEKHGQTMYVCVCMHSCCIHSPCHFWHFFLFILHGQSIYFPTFQNGAAKSPKTLKTYLSL